MRNVDCTSPVSRPRTNRAYDVNWTYITFLFLSVAKRTRSDAFEKGNKKKTQKKQKNWSIINYVYFTALLQHTNIYTVYADFRAARAQSPSPKQWHLPPVKVFVTLVLVNLISPTNKSLSSLFLHFIVKWTYCPLKIKVKVIRTERCEECVSLTEKMFVTSLEVLRLLWWGPSVWSRLLTGCRCLGSSLASLGSHLYRAPGLHGVRPPSEALCQTQMQICWCTQI